jgi:hypothetical protein
VGLFVQDAVIVIVWPVNGVLLLAVNVHAGTGVGAAFQSTTTYAVLLPDALAAVTPYVTWPTDEDDAPHWTCVQVIPIQL